MILRVPSGPAISIPEVDALLAPHLRKKVPLDFGAVRDSAILLLIANQGVLGIVHAITPFEARSS
jgi:hypothetical protein